MNYWKAHNLPPPINVLDIIRMRAQRYYAHEAMKAEGWIIAGDSRDTKHYTHLAEECKVRWVITSPPYYGMKTYLPDQWLRSWFVGGTAQVDYSMEGQVSHASPEIFALQLREVWRNVGGVCAPSARIVVRFGAINDRKIDALQLLKYSLEDSGWEVTAICSAGSASRGRRQALHFSSINKGAIEEYDVWGMKTG